MINPYEEVSYQDYGSDVFNVPKDKGFVYRMFRGDNNLRLGRPKYLSDQLFTKSLFGSIYESREAFDDALST